MNSLAHIAFILFLQSEDKSAHPHAKDKEMMSIEEQTQDHKQLFDTRVPNSELKEHHHQFDESSERGILAERVL